MKIYKSKNQSILSKISFSLIFILLVFVLIKPTPSFAYPCTGVDPETQRDLPDGCDPTELPTGTGNIKTGTGNIKTGTGDIKTGTGDIKTGTGGGVNINTGISNPLSSDLDTIPKFIEAILNFVLMIGVPIVTLAIIYAGFLFVTASGNSEKLKKAKQTLMYTLIGAALLLGSLVISNAIKGTVEEINSANTQ